jgi:hypothetical protein
MKLPHRRHFLHLAAGTPALLVSSRSALADTYPMRPVRLIVGYPPGTTPDILGRIVRQWLSERLAAPFVVENRPGGRGDQQKSIAVGGRPSPGLRRLLPTPARSGSISNSPLMSRRRLAVLSHVALGPMAPYSIRLVRQN